MFEAARRIDRTRPILDASGYSHRLAEADVYDCHDYEQNPDIFASHHAALLSGEAFRNGPSDRPWSIPWNGQPFMVSEFGGAWWGDDRDAEESASWGYGDRPTTAEDFLQRFARLCGALLDNPCVAGYCYTQLTDVFQEHNGVYRFDRRVKLDPTRFRAAQSQPAAVERHAAPVTR